MGLTMEDWGKIIYFRLVITDVYEWKYKRNMSENKIIATLWVAVHVVYQTLPFHESSIDS